MSNLSFIPDLASLPLLLPIAGNNFAQTAQTDTAISAEARAVLEFWRSAGPNFWFAKDEAFDARFRDQFLAFHVAAARGTLAGWATTAGGALALVILLDQFPRNAFRGTSRMYDTDADARRAADTAVKSGHDRSVDQDLAKFFYLPFAHSEDLADQERAVELVRRLGEPDLSRAIHHRDIIQRFGRFPHRNPILGRATTPAEQTYLETGGYKG